MTYPLARLVSGPDPSATVRYDFNDEDVVAPRRVSADFSLGVPALLTAPDAVSPAYGFRSISMGHVIRGSKSDALAALAVLSRELLRSSSWFLFQVDAFTRPVWFRIYSTSPEALSFEQVYVDTATGDPTALADFWEVRATFTADAFGYGERITLGPYTVQQTLEGDNPMRVLLPTIKGDAPTSLRVEVKAATTNATTSQMLLGLVSGDSVSDMLFDIGTGDGWTVDGVGAISAPVSNANYLGGEYRTATVSWSTSGVMTGTVSNLLPGRYKVMLRCELDPVDPDTTQRYALTFGQSVNGSIRWGETAQQESGTPDVAKGVPTSPFQGWVDLGQHAIPLGTVTPDDLAEATTPVDLDAALKVSTFTGDGVARLDALKFIPIDGPSLDGATMLVSSFESEVANQSFPLLPLSHATSCAWDGDTGLAWMRAQPGGSLKPSAVVLRGGFPVADPAAVENVLIVLPLARGRSTASNAGTAISTQWTVTPSYQPRLLHVDGRP